MLSAATGMVTATSSAPSTGPAARSGCTTISPAWIVVLVVRPTAAFRSASVSASDARLSSRRASPMVRSSRWMTWPEGCPWLR